MARLLRVCVLAATGLVLAGCLSGDPRISEVDQVSAEQRNEMTGTESADDESESARADTAEFIAIDIAYENESPEVLDVAGHRAAGMEGTLTATE